MEVTLTPQAEAALRQELIRSPGRRPEEIVEEALTDLGRRAAASSATNGVTTREDFRAWLGELRRGAKPVPGLAEETFSREIIYQDHD